MAIDKNFVIKNGLEVNTNVLVAAADEKQVGIGTTRPYYKLHVGGGEGSRGGIGATDLTISGIATIGVAHSDSGAFKVLGISTFQGDVDLLGSAGVSTVRWDASKDGLIFQDNATARFGTGEDLRIWHDGSNSYISDQGTGSLIIYGTDETLAVFTDDGSVQLYNNDSKKLETTGLGITVYGDSIVSGVTTTARLNVTGIATVGTALSMNDNVKAQFGTGGDLIIFHSGTASKIKDSSGDLSLSSDRIYLELQTGTNILKGDQFGVIVTGVTTTNRLLVTGISTFTGNVDANGGLTANTAIIEDLTNNRVVIAGTGGEIEDDANFTYDGVGLNIGAGSGVTVSNTGNIAASGIVTANSGVQVGTSATISSTGNAAFAGIITANGGVKVGTAFTVDANTGNVAVSGILTVGGNLSVTGDITYDEVTGRNLNITGITTLAGQANFGTSGVGATIAANGNATFSGIVTAKEYVGVFTSAGGAGIGIGSTTAHVGYGVTYIDFKGPGVSTVYSSSVTGITTIYFQGGGGSGVGAAGTWQNDGTSGISTAKSVGINTVGVAVTALMGGVKGASSGIGASMQGLYIGNGMMINDNQLNGNHYIGTAFGGIMAGPVTVNGVVTVDGNWAVV